MLGALRHNHTLWIDRSTLNNSSALRFGPDCGCGTAPRGAAGAYAVTEMITVLVIDADPAVRLAVRRVLEPIGVTLLAVANSRPRSLGSSWSGRIWLSATSTRSPRTACRRSHAIADIDASAQKLILFPEQRDTPGYAPLRRKKPFTPSELLAQVRRAG